MGSRLSTASLRGTTRRAKATRALIFAVLVISAATCVAPGLYAATDCDRWIKEYRQGLLQARAARRLRLAKTQLLVAVRRPRPAGAHHPLKHRMGPLESLRRFQVDCGELDTVEPLPMLVELPFIPLEMPPLTTTTIAELTIPTFVTPEVPNVVSPPQEVALVTPATIPEPASLVLVVTGAAMAAGQWRRRRQPGTFDSYRPS